MALIRFHNTGINTDWIVRWEDDEGRDILVVTVGAAGAIGGAITLRMHGEQRAALLSYLTATSEDLVAGDPWLGPRHERSGIPLGVRRVRIGPDGATPAQAEEDL